MWILLIVDLHLINFPKNYLLYKIVFDALLHVHLQRSVVLIDQVAIVQIILF